MKSTAFNPTSSGFLISVITAILAIFAAAGLELPMPADVLAGDIGNTLSTSGVWATVGIIAASLARPVLKWWNSPKPSFAAIIGSAGTWVAIVQLALGALVLKGVAIGEDAGSNVVGAVFMKDWLGLVSVAFVGIVEPLVRWLIDRRKTATA